MGDGRGRLVLVLGLLLLGVLALSRCEDAVEEDSGAGKTESVGTNGEERTGKGEAPKVEPVAEETPTKVPREEGAVKDGRPAPPKGPTATWIPGKPGFCFNPFTNNPVDVRGIPPASLVKDPMDEEKDRVFRVPE